MVFNKQAVPFKPRRPNCSTIIRYACFRVSILRAVDWTSRFFLPSTYEEIHDYCVFQLSYDQSSRASSTAFRRPARNIPYRVEKCSLRSGTNEKRWPAWQSTAAVWPRPLDTGGQDYIKIEHTVYKTILPTPVPLPSFRKVKPRFERWARHCVTITISAMKTSMPPSEDIGVSELWTRAVTFQYARTAQRPI